MLKRILTLSLSVMMLTSLCPTTSVFAADGKPAAIVEDFEDGSLDSSIKDEYVSVWGKDPYKLTTEIVDEIGCDGGKALRITDLYNTACLTIPAAYNVDTSVSVLSYNIQVAKAPSSTDGQSNKGVVIAGAKANAADAFATIYLYRKASGRTSEFSFKNTDGDFSDLEIGEWYKIVNVRSADTVSSWVLDKHNNVLLYQNKTGVATQSEFTIIRGTTNYMGDPSKSSYETGEILIDNISFLHYNASTYSFSVTDSSIENTATNIPRNTNSITVALDGKIASGDALLKPEVGDNVVCTVAPTVSNSKELPLTYTISWEGTLESNTGYTLDLTGLKNEKGVASTEQITFTTLDASKVHLWEKPIISDVNGNTVTFKLIDNPEYANTSFTGAVMAVVLRGNQMVDFDIVVPEAPATSFSVGGDITIDFEFAEPNWDTLQLIQMDTANGLTPLAWAE